MERTLRAAHLVVGALTIGVVTKPFEFEGKRYEIHKSAPISKRTWLREAGQSEVLLSADHYALKTTYFRGDGAEELCDRRAQDEHRTSRSGGRDC